MGKIQQLSEKLKSSQHGALITSDVNRHYFSGFKSSAGIILVTKEQSYLLIDFRYFDKAKAAVNDCQVILMEDSRKQLMELLLHHDISQLSIENATMTVSMLDNYKDKLSYVDFDATSWLSDTIMSMRTIKSEDEVKKIRIAQSIAEKAFSKLIGKIKVGYSEKHVAAMLDYFMMEGGADGLSFDTIAASGVNSASPHATPTEKPLADGDFLTLDFGAIYDGYHSDMTRTVVIGKPTDKMQEMYSAVLSANLDALKAAKAGITGKLLDSVARSTLDAWGYAEYFGHGLGHGVGMEIHEAPNASPKSTTTLQEGMIITIEPGVYISGEYGVRIEDMVVITKDGCKNLTKTPKKLIYI